MPRPGSLTRDNLQESLLEVMEAPAILDRFRRLLKEDREDLAKIIVSQLSDRLDAMETAIAAKDKEIKDLKGKLQTAEQKLDNQEQYSRRTSVRLSGIPEPENGAHDDPDAEMQKIFTALEITPVINRVHRVGPKRSGAARPILCQFVSYPDRTALLKRRKDLRARMPNVYINEDLTRDRSRAYYKARCLKRQKKILDTWTSEGRIVVKDKSGKIIYIVNENELNQFS